MKFTRKRIIIILGIFSITITSVISCNNAKDKETINAKAILDRLSEGKPVNIIDKTIEGTLDFTKLEVTHLERPNYARIYIEPGVSFYHCTFTDTIKAFNGEGTIAKAVDFEQGITIYNSSVNHPVKLREAKLGGSLNFANSIFYKAVNLEGINAQGNENVFSEAIFKDKVSFNRAKFSGNVSALQSNFEGAADFRGTDFMGDVRMGNASFGTSLAFSMCNFYNTLYLNFSSLKEARFGANKFFGKLSLRKIKIEDTLEFDGNYFYNDTAIISSQKIKYINNFFIKQ